MLQQEFSSPLFFHTTNLNPDWFSSTAQAHLSTDLSDKQILAYLQQGSGAARAHAAHVLYTRYTPRLLRQLRRQRLTEDEVSDIFSQVWLVFYENLPMLQWQDKPLGHYLAATASVLTRAHFGKMGRQLWVALDEDVIAPFVALRNDPYDEQTAAADERGTATMRAFVSAYMESKASALDEQLLHLIFFEGVTSNGDLAEILDKSNSAIRTARHRLRHRMIQFWDSSQGGLQHLVQ